MKNPGKIVQHKTTGMVGRTYNEKGLINGKIPVYYETSKFEYGFSAVLTNPENLRLIGYID